MKLRMSKRWLAAALMVCGFLSSGTLIGVEGAGSSGGGGGLTDAGKLKLREFVEGVTCEWVDGPHFFGTYTAAGSEVSGVDMLLHTKLGFLFRFLIGDPQMLEAYYAESLNLNVCLSSKPLRQLPEELRESVSAYQTIDIDKKIMTPVQIAIRIGYDLFVDKAAFGILDKVNQDYFKLHEISHGYIPMDVPARMTKLRDFIAGVREIDLAFPLRSNGNYEYDLAPNFHDLMAKQTARYQALKANNDVSFDIDGPKVSRELGLVERYVISGDVSSLAYTMKRYHLQPNQPGRSGRSLFHELIFQLSQCLLSDPRPMCTNSLSLVSLYLGAGAEPDLLYSTGEWQPMPVWKYLLFSMNRTGRENRLSWADAIFKQKIKVAGSFTSELKAEAEETLFTLVRDNFLAKSTNLVLTWGADVNARNAEGKTPLLVAVERKGHGNNLFSAFPATYLIGVLLSANADTSVKNADGKTALEIMKDFKGPLRPLYDSKEVYELGVKALEVGPAGLNALKPDFERLGMKLP